MADEGTKRRGRPAKPLGDAARGPLTIRLRSEVRADVERAAVRYGRSLSEEIENRLEISFAHTQYIRQEIGEDLFRIVHAMAASLSHIEDWAGKSWIEDDETFNTFQATVTNLIRNYRDLVTKAEGRPTLHGDFEGRSVEELGEMFAAVGGLAPPRPRKPAPPAEPSDEQLEARALSKANMRARLAAKSAGEEGEA